MQKQEILKLLLEGYDDGRRKKLESLTLKEKSAYVVKQFQSLAEQRGVVLKWNRKPSRPKK